jgi:molybdate transport system permease protein
MDMLPNPAETEALLLSLQISTVAILCALPFAFAAALALARPAFPGKTVFDLLVHLPLVLPPVAVGYLLLILLGTRGPIGGFLDQTFGFRLVFNWTGAALASAFITFPLQVRAIRISIEAMDHDLSEAAESLGARWFDRLFNVTLPLAIPGIVAGALTAFAASLGEFGAIITFVSSIPGETRTIPLAIYAALQSPDGDLAAARLCAISILLAFIVLGLAQLAARRLVR